MARGRDWRDRRGDEADDDAYADDDEIDEEWSASSYREDTGGSYDAFPGTIYDATYDVALDTDSGADEGNSAAYGGGTGDVADRALAPLGAGSTPRPTLMRSAEGPPEATTIIPGSGVSMGIAFIKRRPRSLTLNLTLVALTAVLIATGLFSVTPLGSSASANLSSFQALSGRVLVNQGVTYHWYVTKPGDEVETLAAQFHVAVGGIYELNNLVAGMDLPVGVALKIPDDPFYGQNFRPPSLLSRGNGSTVFGNDWWTSHAGNPLPEQPCAPDGGGNPTGYQFHSPLPGAGWVRGYSWYHNGDDIALAAGTPIHAVQAGVVIWAGWTNYGFGYSVVISHCYYLSSLYGHMSQLLVKAGQYVHPGDVLGLEGATGWATGPHLHLSVLEHDQFVDPLAYYGYSVCRLTGTC